MTIKVHPIIAGSNAPLEVQFLDAATDDAVSLVGCTGYSATAKNTDTETIVHFDTPLVTDAANGKLRLEWIPSAFETTGTYAVQVKFTDAAGNTAILPSEAGQLLFKVGAAND